MGKSSKVLWVIRLIVYPIAIFFLAVLAKQELQWMRIKREMAESTAGLEELTRDIEKAQKELDAQLTPKLRLEALHCEQGSMYIIIKGLVSNISDEAIEAKAIGSIYDSGGTFLDSGGQLLEYYPISPGQSSPFHAYIPSDPAFATCSVAFRTTSGRKIMTIDAPPTTTTEPKTTTTKPKGKK